MYYDPNFPSYREYFRSEDYSGGDIVIYYLSILFVKTLENIYL